MSQSDRPAHFLQLFNIVVMLAVFSEITRQKLKIWLAALVIFTRVDQSVKYFGLFNKIFTDVTASQRLFSDVK